MAGSKCLSHSGRTSWSNQCVRNWISAVAISPPHSSWRQHIAFERWRPSHGPLKVQTHLGRGYCIHAAHVQPRVIHASVAVTLCQNVLAVKVDVAYCLCHKGLVCNIWPSSPQRIHLLEYF